MQGTPKIMTAVDDTVVDVKLNPACIIGGYVDNLSGDDALVLFYDKPAAEVTVGVTPIAWQVRAYSLSQSPITRAGEGIIFNTAISVCSVATEEPTPTGRPATVNMIIQ